MNTPDVTLDPVHAVELAELLGYIADWIDTNEPDLHKSHRLYANGPYPLEELRSDLLRFAWLLGAEHIGGEW